MNAETIAYAFSLIGIPYKWGGSNPISGFDCSGFVQEVLASCGMAPKGDQNAQGIYDHFEPISIRGLMGPGALLFYGASPDHIEHIALGVNLSQAIGANGGRSTTINSHEADIANAFIKLRPYDYRKDLVAILMPKYKWIVPPK